MLDSNLSKVMAILWNLFKSVTLKQLLDVSSCAVLVRTYFEIHIPASRQKEVEQVLYFPLESI